MSLPVLISIPHGGAACPAELTDRVAIGAPELMDDIDPYTGEIFDMGRSVRSVLRAAVARTFIDLNRPRDDRPPANPDGVVKTVTIHGIPVYLPGRQPGDDLVERLLAEHWVPYHERLREAVRDPALELALDCHSMAAVGPDVGPDTGVPRPAVCIGCAGGAACDTATARKFAACIRREFGLPADEVTIDEPFAGGYITRAYGNDPIPWLQVEINRRLYLDHPRFEPGDTNTCPANVKKLQDRFRSALEQFFSG